MLLNHNNFVADQKCPGTVFTWCKTVLITNINAKTLFFISIWLIIFWVELCNFFFHFPGCYWSPKWVLSCGYWQVSKVTYIILIKWLYISPNIEPMLMQQITANQFLNPTSWQKVSLCPFMWVDQGFCCCFQCFRDWQFQETLFEAQETEV